MIFKLKCKSCGNVVVYNSEVQKETYQKCPNCEQLINGNVETKLDNVADMREFELIGIEHSFSSKLLAEDLANIEKIFDKANEEKQKMIVNIIDKLYLMLDTDDDDTTKDLEKLLKEYFLNSCGKGIRV